MRRQRTWIVAAILAMGSCAAATAGPAGCTIVEGAEVAGVKIDMPVATALAVTGPSTKQEPSGTTVTYLLRQPWAYMMADGGLVRQIGTRTPACRTTRGVGPGSSGQEVRGAYATSQISTITSTQDGDRLSYPFHGIAFLVRQDRVDTVEIFRAERAAGVRPAPRAAAAAPPAVPRSPTPRSSPATAPGTRDRQQVAGIVAKQLEVTVQSSRNPPSPDSFSVTVANRSGMTVSVAAVAADFTVMCNAPTARRLRRGANFSEVRSGVAVVQQLRPGASVTVPLVIGPGTCADFATWSVKTRVTDVKIAEGS